VPDDGTQQLVVPLTLFRHPHAAISTNELVAIGEVATKTWGEANIKLEPKVVEYPFADWLNTSLPLDRAMLLLADALVKHYRTNTPPTNVMGFYGPWSDGDNGASFPHRYWDSPDSDVPILPFFVRDHQENGSPPLERVTAHEVGHLLRLPHYFKPTQNLLARGVVGTELDPHEVDIARAGARWLLERSK